MFSQRDGECVWVDSQHWNMERSAAWETEKSSEALENWCNGDVPEAGTLEFDLRVYTQSWDCRGEGISGWGCGCHSVRKAWRWIEGGSCNDELPDTGVSGTHLEPGCRDWNTVRTSWQFGTCPPGRENNWRKAHRKSAPRADGASMAEASRERPGAGINFSALKVTGGRSRGAALTRWGCGSWTRSAQHPSAGCVVSPPVRPCVQLESCASSWSDAPTTTT